MLFKSQSNISIFKHPRAKMCAIFSLFLIDGIVFTIGKKIIIYHDLPKRWKRYKVPQ